MTREIKKEKVPEKFGWEIEYVPKNKLQVILTRHINTIKEFKEKLARMIN